MNELIKFRAEIKEQTQVLKIAVKEDAKETGGKWRKAIEYLKQNKNDFGSRFNAKAEDQADVWFNAVLEEAIRELIKEGLDKKI